MNENRLGPPGQLFGAEVRTLVAGEAPVASIILPSLDGDRGGNVGRLVEQLQRQTLTDIEVLVVVGVRPNGRARNVGARRARGTFLVFIDDDVTLGTADLLQRLLDPFTQADNIGMVGCSQQVPDDATPFEQRAARQLDRMISPVVEAVEDTDMATHMCMAMPRALYEALGGEHEHLPRGTDPELRQRLRQAGWRVVLAPQTWAYHPPPGSWREVGKIYYRNGFGSRYVADQFPEGTIHTTAGHGGDVATGSTAERGAGFVSRVGEAVLRGQPIRLWALANYAVGYLNAWLWEPQWRRIKLKQWALRTVFVPVGKVRQAVTRRPAGVRILLYHRIGLHRYRNLMVHRDAFAAQLAWLRQHYDVLPLSEALALLENSTPLQRDVVVLTFDDITRDWPELVLPLLAEHDVRVSVFPAAGALDSEVEFPWLRHEEPPDYHPLTSQQVRELAAAGHEIGSHTVSHPRLARCPAQQQREELQQARAQLAACLGEAPFAVAYPFGRLADVSEETVAQARAAGYRCGLLAVPGINVSGCDCFRLLRTPIDPGDSPGLFRAKVNGTLDVLQWRENRA